MENSEKGMLQVTAVSEVRQDVNTNDFKRITVKPLAGTYTDPATGEVHPIIDMNAREVSFNQYKESYLDGSMDPAYNAPIKTLIPGAIISKSVEDYSFTNLEGEVIEASSYTTAVFGDTTDVKLFESNIFAAFRRAKHQLEEDTFVSAKQNIEVDATNPIEA